MGLGAGSLNKHFGRMGTSRHCLPGYFLHYLLQILITLLFEVTAAIGFHMSSGRIALLPVDAPGSLSTSQARQCLLLSQSVVPLSF